MKKITAVIMALAMVFAISFSFAGCGKKSDSSATIATEKPEETKIAEDVVVTSVDEEGNTVEEVIKAPETTAEILAYYNDAVNKAYDEKVGFSKTRYTDGANFDMSVALKAFQGLVEKFVGIGEENKYSETVTKGNWDTDAKKEYLRKSTLTEADITNATIGSTEDGCYIITINVKGGSSKGDKDHTSSTSPIDKCGICVGNEDKGYYDHKSGPVIYDAIAGTYSGAKITESYSNAVIVAKINAETGELVNLAVDFSISVGIDISIGSGTATGNTHIKYTDFKY